MTISQRPLNCASSARAHEARARRIAGTRIDIAPNLTQVLLVYRRELAQIQTPGVDRHPDGGVNSHGLERAYLLDSCDAPGGRDLERGRGPEPPEPVEVGSLHHAFFVDVCAKKAGTIRLE